MAYLLSNSEFQKIHPFFQSPQLGLVGDAILAGNSPAQVWVDDPGQPRSALVWDGSHCFYLLGEAENQPFRQALGQLFDDCLLPDVTNRNLGLIKMYPGSAGWEEYQQGFFRGIPFKQAGRVFFALREPKIRDWRERVPEGFSIQPVDHRLLSNPTLQNVNLLVEEIESMWNTVDAFLEKGFGRCVTTNGEVAGWSTIEYLSPGRCGVGVETIEAYQRHGIATLAASAVVEECHSRGLQAYWDSWKFNQPSLSVAERVGFETVCEYTVSYAWVTTEQVK